MRVERLRLQDFRLFEQLELELGPGLNLFVGGNGAGKTSILEALHLMAYGRSFRGAVRDGLIRRGAAALQVYCEVRVGDGDVRRLGLRRGVREWEARVDGAPVAALSDLYRGLAVVCFEPGSHALIGGGSEYRRRYLDWFLFHVEPQFLPVWRRHQRALRQRNALLKSESPEPGGLEAWERELAEAGEHLTQQRRTWLAPLTARIAALAAALLPELGPVQWSFQPGWSEDDGLAAALVASRRRDLALGHTGVGPHRADWQLRYERLPHRDMLSRGQEKLTALACLLAQAETLAEVRGEWPVLCLDDLASELDRTHLGWALDWLGARPAQWLLTGTEPPAGTFPPATRTFHVEQGRLARLL